MTELPSAIPAATLVLMRRGTQGTELLFMERTSRMAFAAGALVFPGGRVDADDEAIARKLATGIEHGAARVAAIRETIEEVGVAVGFADAPDRALVRQMQQRLHGEEPFSAILSEVGLDLDLDALLPFVRWSPPPAATRRFDTIFFVAEAPEDDAGLFPDEREVARAFWASADQVLKDDDAGRARVIYPTRRNLERLASLGSIENARAHLAEYPMYVVEPWIEECDGVEWLCIPEGIGYPVTREPLKTARRG
jgi:8-oxo-dGTP pyrophosphatase MutT (NUDIX family)